MEYKLYCIKDKKQHLLENGEVVALPDGILDGYIRRTVDSIRRKAWKSTGEGAKFTGAYEPGMDEESRLRRLRSCVYAICEHDGEIYFVEQIGETSGIYRKKNAYDTTEGIVDCTNENRYIGLDIQAGQIAAAVSFAGQSHIAVGSMPGAQLKTVTEGNSIELDPAWSKTKPGVLYFSSAGLPESVGDDIPEQRTAMLPADFVGAMSEAAAATRRGPSSICRFNVRTGTLDVLLEDEAYDFIKPKSTEAGTLYYIKSPYGEEKEKKSGCLVDFFLLPVRLIGALFNFLSIFSIKYSGKPLSSAGVKAKPCDEKKIMIDGNLINAEKELKANASDPYPGIIPKKRELWRIDKNGEHTLVRAGVLCYTIDADGCVVYSNGKYIIRINADGRDEKLAVADGVTYLNYLSV